MTDEVKVVQSDSDKILAKLDSMNTSTTETLKDMDTKLNEKLEKKEKELKTDLESVKNDSKKIEELLLENQKEQKGLVLKMANIGSLSIGGKANKFEEANKIADSLKFDMENGSYTFERVGKVVDKRNEILELCGEGLEAIGTAFEEKNNLKEAFMKFADTTPGINRSDIPSHAGIFVPKAITTAVQSIIFERSNLAPLFKSYSSATNIPIKTSIPSAFYRYELNKVQRSRVITYAEKQLEPHGMSSAVQYSIELANAVGKAEAVRLTIMDLGQAFSDRLSYDYVNGDGTAKPVGFIKDTETVARFDINSLTIGFDDLIDMKTKIKSSAGASVWIMSKFTFSMLRKIKDDINNYINFQGNLKFGDQAEILGLPVIQTDDVTIPNPDITYDGDQLPPENVTLPYMVAPDAEGDFPIDSQPIVLCNPKEMYSIANSPFSSMITDPYSHSDRGLTQITMFRWHDGKPILGDRGLIAKIKGGAV